MQEAPQHGSDAVEELKSGVGPVSVDRSGCDQQAEVAVNLLGRPVGDSPEMSAIATGSAMAFGEIGRHRAGRTNELVRDWFEWSRYLYREPDCDAGSLDGVFIDGET